MIAIDLRFSEALIRRAILRYWWRSTGWLYLAAIILVLTALTYKLSLGEYSWLTGVLAAIAGMGILMAVSLYAVHLRGSLARFRRLEDGSARLEIDETWVRVRSRVGSSEFRWEVFIELWRFPECWLLFFSKAQFMTLPVADLTPEAKTLLCEKIRDHGGKVL